MTFPVKFLYFESMAESEFVAMCDAVPRAGELIMPERGDIKIVDHVFHPMTTQADRSIGLMPHVVLRSPDETEKQKVAWIGKKENA